MGLSGIFGSILGLVVSCYVAGQILPDAIESLSNSTVWSSTPAVIQSLGGTIAPIVAICAFLYMLIRSAGIGGD